jgi:peptidoglycan/xylan/chitin deacetylase (PgdA/CDA1 family)
MRGTGELLDELARAGLHATFFVTGWSIKPATYHHLQRALADGHLLGNHGWRHDGDMAARYPDDGRLEAYIAAEFELTQIRVDLALLADSPADFAALDREVFAGLTIRATRDRQLKAMEGIRERHAAVLAARGYEPGTRPYQLRWVRPPGGNPYLGARFRAEQRDAFARAVAGQGLVLAMWSTGSGDSDPTLTYADRMDPERVVRTLRQAVRRGGIYVAHDRLAPAAMRALVRELADLRDTGDALPVDLDELLTTAYVAAGWCGAGGPPPANAGAGLADTARTTQARPPAPRR